MKRLLFLVCVATLSRLMAIDTGAQSAANLFEYRYGIAPQTDLPTLVRRGQILGTLNTVVTDPQSKEKRLSGYGEYHAVFEVSTELFLAVLLDFSAYSEILPYINSVMVLSSDSQRQVVRINSGIKTLGLDLQYEVVSESEIDRLANGAVGLRSRLLESPDGKMYEHYLSWYLSPVEIDGRHYTYVRYFNKPGIRNPFPGMALLARLFAESNLRSQVDGIYEEAQRRMRATDPASTK